MKARRRARRCVVQALYQRELSGMEMAAVIAAFAEEETFRLADQQWFRKLAQGIEAHQGELDATLEPCMSRPWSQLDPVVRAVLYTGLYELRYCPELPWKVAINEAVELAREFAGEGAHRYVNAVLDCARKSADSGLSPGQP